MKIRILKEKIQAYLNSKSTLLSIRLSRTNARITDLLVWLAAEELRIRTSIIRTPGALRKDDRGVVAITVPDAEIDETEVWYQDFLAWVKARRLDDNQARVDALFGPESMRVFHASNLVFLDFQADQSKQTLKETLAALGAARTGLAAARADIETKDGALSELAVLTVQQRERIASLSSNTAELLRLKTELEATGREIGAAKRETFAAQELRAEAEKELASIKRALFELNKLKEEAEGELKAQEAKNTALRAEYDRSIIEFKTNSDKLSISLAALKLELRHKEAALAAATSAVRADAAAAKPTTLASVALSGGGGAGGAGGGVAASASLSYKELTLSFLTTFDSNPAAGGAGGTVGTAPASTKAELAVTPREQLLTMRIKEETLRILEMALEKLEGDSDSKRDSLLTSASTAAAATAAKALKAPEPFVSGLTNVRDAAGTVLKRMTRRTTSTSTPHATPPTTPSATSAAAAVATDSVTESSSTPSTPTSTLTDTATSNPDSEKMAFYNHLCDIIKQHNLFNNELSVAQLACLSGHVELLASLIPPGSSERIAFLNSPINPLGLAAKSASLLMIDFINKNIKEEQRTLEVIHSAARTGKTWIIEFALDIVGAEKVDVTTLDNIIASGSKDALNYARKKWPAIAPSELFLIQSMEEAYIERVKFILTWWLSENLTFSEDLAARLLMAACLSGQEIALDFTIAWINCLEEKNQGNILTYIDEFTKIIQNFKSRPFRDQKEKTRLFISNLIKKRSAKGSAKSGMFKPLTPAAETEGLKAAAIELFKVAARVNDQESIRFARTFGVTEADVEPPKPLYEAPPRAGSPYY